VDGFIGEIRMFAFDFVPSGWALCDGRILPIAQNLMLYTVIGAEFGGDDMATFGLPDLRGRVPMQAGQGVGLSPHVLNERGGTEAVTLTPPQLPSHTHPQRANLVSLANANAPGPDVSLAVSSNGAPYQDAPNGNLASEAVGATGGSQPHNNLQPYVTFNFCIAMTGVMP
jgi:microcystin-dependent protein